MLFWIAFDPLLGAQKKTTSSAGTFGLLIFNPPRLCSWRLKLETRSLLIWTPRDWEASFLPPHLEMKPAILNKKGIRLSRVNAGKLISGTCSMQPFPHHPRGRLHGALPVYIPWVPLRPIAAARILFFSCTCVHRGIHGLALKA